MKHSTYWFSAKPWPCQGDWICGLTSAPACVRAIDHDRMDQSLAADWSVLAK